MSEAEILNNLFNKADYLMEKYCWVKSIEAMSKEFDPGDCIKFADIITDGFKKRFTTIKRA